MTKEKALSEAVWFMYPESTRGPGNPRWSRAMTDLAKAYNFPECEGCCGIGQREQEVCSACLGIGRVPSSVT